MDAVLYPLRMILLFVLIVSIATGLSTVFVESFHRYSEISRVEMSADTIAEVSATTYAKVYTQKKNECVLKEMRTIPQCIELPLLNECIEKKAISCDESMDECTTAAQVSCSSRSEEFKRAAQSVAEDAAHAVAAKTSGATLDLMFADSGEVIAHVEKDYAPLLPIGTGGQILRESTAQAFTIDTK